MRGNCQRAGPVRTSVSVSFWLLQTTFQTSEARCAPAAYAAACHVGLRSFACRFNRQVHVIRGRLTQPSPCCCHASDNCVGAELGDAGGEAWHQKKRRCFTAKEATLSLPKCRAWTRHVRKCNRHTPREALCQPLTSPARWARRRPTRTRARRGTSCRTRLPAEQSRCPPRRTLCLTRTTPTRRVEGALRGVSDVLEAS